MFLRLSSVTSGTSRCLHLSFTCIDQSVDRNSHKVPREVSELSVVRNGCAQGRLTWHELRAWCGLHFDVVNFLACEAFLSPMKSAPFLFGLSAPVWSRLCKWV